MKSRQRNNLLQFQYSRSNDPIANRADNPAIIRIIGASLALLDNSVVK